jgi:hypothetical protein
VTVLAPEPLAVEPLVTVDQVRAHCLRDVGDASMDYLWDLLIPSVSEAASLWADRQFSPVDDVTRGFPATARIMFSPWELRTITSVETENADALDYALFPPSGTSMATYFSMVVAETDALSVVVTGDWGMAAIPPSVQLAVLIAIDSYYRNPSMHSSESLGSYSFSEVVSQWEIGGLPRASRSLLDNFRRISVT